jgi:hypothetical protein
MKRLSCATALAVGASLMLGAPSGARADQIYTLSTANPSLAGLTGPYATVDVHLNSATSATITFTSLTNGGNTYLFGGAQAVDVNVNAATFTVSGITATNSFSGFLASPTPTFGGTNNADGLGTFNATIDSFDGFQHASDSISFTVTDVSGTWASAASVLTPTNSGESAAAHIYACTSPCTEGTGGPGANGSTGFAADGLAPVPGPIAGAGLPGLMLAGAGLLCWLQRRRRVEAAA